MQSASVSGTTIRTTSDSNDSNDKISSTSTIRVLALHGSEGTAKDFERVLTDLSEPSFFAHGIDWQITAVNAPFPKGKGYSWWTLPKGERSFTAVEYPGFEQSAALIHNTMTKQGPFDLVLAHSQGSILVTALLALDRFSHHPPLGYVLNGGAWPNPYAQQLERLQFTDGKDNDDTDEREHNKSTSSRSRSSCRPRVLVVTGENDQINPPASQVQVQEALAIAGAKITTLQHSGGHAVPTQNTDAITQLVDWVAEGIAKYE
jgi:predicted esterase